MIPNFSIHFPIFHIHTSQRTNDYRNPLLDFLYTQLAISLSRSWHFSSLSDSFLCVLLSPGAAISIIIHFFSLFATTTMSRRLASIMWSHWTLTSHNTSHSLFSLTLWGTCSYHFSVLSNLFFFPQSYKCIIRAMLSCRLLYSFWANFLYSQTICPTLSPFSHTFYITGSWMSISYLT